MPRRLDRATGRIGERGRAVRFIRSTVPDGPSSLARQPPPDRVPNGPAATTPENARTHAHVRREGPERLLAIATRRPLRAARSTASTTAM
jgi:hypothetical protein